MRERLKQEPSEVVCKYLFEPAIKDESDRSFDNMISLNLVHTLMLHKKDIITTQDKDNIINALLELSKDGSNSIELDPLLEDYYFNFEKHMISKIGIEFAGKMHIARSRNDINSTISRMNARDSLIRVFPKLLRLRSILLSIASRNLETVLTGYTHMQPAQPISLAHYFLSLAQALERDFDRLQEAYKKLNYSPLGSCAFAGTSFDIDRNFTAELLGFYGPIDNSLDAIASRDYLMEIVADLTILSTNVSRLAQDLYIWSTDEFNYIEVDDSMAVCSSIMPQKKNPITLEHIKAKSAHLIAAFVSISSILRGISFGHSRDVGSESIKFYWESMEQIEAILDLMNDTLDTININKENMINKARVNFSTVTEIADELVRREGISFRVSHQIVGTVVRNCLESGTKSDEITVEMIDKVARENGLNSIKWDQQELDKITDPYISMINRISYGSPGPKVIKLSLDKYNNELEKDVLVYENIIKELESSYKKLNQYLPSSD